VAASALAHGAGTLAILAILSACSGGLDISDDPAAAVAEFAERFPETVGGEPFPVRVSLGDDLRDPGAGAMAEAFGVGLEDVLLAQGGKPLIGAESTTVTAYRVTGASPEALTDRLVELIWMEMADPTTGAVIEGKTVRTAGAGTYVYAAGDTVYSIMGDPSASDELLRALP
jgi:hypothetical protein